MSPTVFTDGMHVMKRSSAHGASTSGDAQVLGITPNALWLLVRGREYMLDVDLGLESLEHPERFPLVARTRRKRR